jgi:hypothetical protein
MSNVQPISPRSGGGWQGQRPVPESGDAGKREPARRKAERPPAEPGTGQLVDREA